MGDTLQGPTYSGLTLDQVGWGAPQGPTAAGGTVGDDWWTRNFGMNSGASSGDLAKALQGASKGLGTPAGGGAPPMAPAPGVGPSGSPRAPSSLDQLVRLLQQRHEALLNSATGVGQAAQPLPAARTTGLLGF
jgi:hypothetical protein